MTPRRNLRRPPRPLAALIALACASLACGRGLGLGGTPAAASPGPLTQAMATLTALAAPAGATPGLATHAGQATAGAPASEVPATVVPFPPGAVLLDPCALITRGEAQALLGAPSGDPAYQGGACAYSDAATHAQVVSVYALPGANARQSIGLHAFLLSSFGMQADEAAMEQVTAASDAGDLAGALRQLAALAAASAGQGAGLETGRFSAQALDAPGEAALWAWKELGSVRQGFLLAAVPQAVVGLEFVLGPKADEAATLAAVQPLVQRIVAGLPPEFTVRGLNAGPGTSVPAPAGSLAPDLAATRAAFTPPPP